MAVERPRSTGSDGASVAAVVGRWHGQGQLRLLLVGHLDTVFAPGTAALRPYADTTGAQQARA